MVLSAYLMKHYFRHAHVNFKAVPEELKVFAEACKINFITRRFRS